MKLLLPVDVARRLDDAVASRLGGFDDRHSLAATAIDEYLMDLVYANRVDSGPSELPSVASDVVVAGRGVTPVLSGEPLPAVAGMERGKSIVDSVSALVDAPLLGLHNRDWPSLWALGVLAELAVEGPVPVRSFMSEVTERAWTVADQIVERLGRKAAALLPTNRDKAQSAESAFQSFAVAAVSRRTNEEGKATVSGPLPLWRAMALTADGNELCVAVTAQGWDLLAMMGGLTPATPHAPECAMSFFEYLQEHAGADWWGFDTMLRLLVESPTRDLFLDGFAVARDWSTSVASSAAQGYLARGREWGVVEPKISDGRYSLTAFGREITDG